MTSKRGWRYNTIPTLIQAGLGRQQRLGSLSSMSNARHPGGLNSTDCEIETGYCEAPSCSILLPYENLDG
jgi:hypothetical protein